MAYGGDLNEILCNSEKEGGRRKLPGFLDNFRDCLDRNNLFDCKPVSGWFTWLYVNSISGTVIQERLDIFLATTDRLYLFPDYRVSSIYTAKSDHCLLLMDASQVTISARDQGSNDYFLYDMCWSKEDACIERVRSTWLRSPGPTISKLQAIGDSLRSWQAEKCVSSKKSMSELQVFLNSCMQDYITDATKAAFLDAKREHKSLLDKDEAYWAQRARVTWLTQGDRNTTYFHARASGRQKKNRIRGLYNENGVWTDNQAEVAGIDMGCVNATVITLIPKIEDPVRMQQLRPISLCTVVYKIVSKTILNCMNSSYLGASNGPNKGASLKLDMEKAFDRVEWTFLRSVLLRMGFHSDWLDLLMDCVTSVTFRIQINGRLTPTIIPQRGLRQGDPIQKGPRVNHLLYADDSIVFLRNSKREASHLKEVLRLFADSSGQRINFGKSTVFFSPSTPIAHRRHLSSILGIAEVSDPGIYLRVPVRVGKNNTNVFGFINEKVDDRVSGWTKRLLSFGGREIFLKSIAQALPQYIMSCYLLSRTITDRITSSMHRVFCAKYFRSGSILDASLPDHASFAWKGLHTALQDLRGGFNPSSNSCLSNQLWSGHDTGTYSARSGYFYLCCSSSLYCRPSLLWKALKTLPTLPKVRIFAWRLAHDCLPTGSRVATTGLGPGMCPFCSTTVETSLHAFRDCTNATKALHLDSFPISVTDSRTTSIFDWLVEVARSLSREDFTKLLLVLWNLLNMQNFWVHDSRLQPVWAIVTSATLLHGDFLVANDNAKKPRSRPFISSPVWQPHYQGTENQSVFVPGRLIYDNVIMEHELLHYLKVFKNGPNKGFAVKLDNEKAYDRVEKSFCTRCDVKIRFCTTIY
ncbi:hypothetical protein GQ457_04G024760 [Hibiscus cannabinus]